MDHAEPIAEAASVALIDSGRVLLIERAFPPYEGRWTLPGGRLEHGETPEECALREVREELGLALDDLRPVLTLSFDSGRPYRLSVFATDRFRGNVVASPEVAAVRWTRPDHLSSLITTPDLDVVVDCAFALFPQRA